MGVRRTPLSERFWRYVNKRQEGCWLWTGAIRDSGYGVINAGGHNGKAERAHRVSWMLHFGSIPEGLCVCHRCDVRLCVNPEHLFLGTKGDNNRDMFTKKRDNRTVRVRGEAHHQAVVSEADVISMRGLRASGLIYKDIASRFGVSLQSVWCAVNGKTWKHLGVSL